MNTVMKAFCTLDTITIHYVHDNSNLAFSYWVFNFQNFIKHTAAHDFNKKCGVSVRYSIFISNRYLGLQLWHVCIVLSKYWENERRCNCMFHEYRHYFCRVSPQIPKFIKGLKIYLVHYLISINLKVISACLFKLWKIANKNKRTFITLMSLEKKPISFLTIYKYTTIYTTSTALYVL